MPSGSKKDPLFLFAFVFYGFGLFWLQIESAIGIKVDFLYTQKRFRASWSIVWR
jgi:hypothetical protein